MSSTRQLSDTDTLFVAGETKTILNHTAGLMILKPRGRRKLSFDDFRERISERMSMVPQFSWKLHPVPGGFDLPYWVEDEKFDPGRHIRRIAVPAPGDERALAEVASVLFSRPHDRRRPLWEVWFIEGLAGGRCAAMIKMHHCLMDGQGAMKLLEILCDPEPDARPPSVPDSIRLAQPGRPPTILEEVSRAYTRLTRFPGEMSRSLVATAMPRLRAQLSWNRPKKEKRTFAPHPVFNADIGPERGYVCGSLPLNKILRVKKHFDVSVNEVVLALVGTALRSYMLRNTGLPEHCLRANMPVSLRSEGDDDFANRITNVVISLETGQGDLAKRLSTIKSESMSVKDMARGRRGGKSATEIVQIMPPMLVHALVSNLQAEQTANMLGSNVAISNVRGSPEPFYLAGAQVESMYPMSVISPGLALNITCVGYNGKLDFGLTLDPDAIVDHWSLMDEMEDALGQYLDLVDDAPRPKKKKSAPHSRREKTTRRKPYSMN
jgi:WS/DGAT/MGAT family acyltransferase